LGVFTSWTTVWKRRVPKDSPPEASGPAERSIEELSEEIGAHAAHMAAGMCHHLELVAECERREAWAGWSSPASWLAWRCGLNGRTAREHVRVARVLEQLPLVHAAFARGELSYTKVRALARVGQAAREADLLNLASVLTAAQLEDLLGAFERVDTDQARKIHETEKFVIYWDDDGSLVVRGRLAPEDGALLVKAIEVTREQLWDRRRAGEHAAVELEGGGSAEPRRPTNVDALVALADTALAHPDAARNGPDRYQIQIQVDPDALRADGDGVSMLADGPAIAPETARRLACDASEIRGSGRKTRRISVPLRRALQARDRCCRFPGCTNRRTDAHHITHWADEGETRLDNLLLLCRRHHRHVHEHGWTVDHSHRFTDPYGNRIPHVPPHPPGTLDGLHHANRHLEITPRTLAGGHGERMDLGLAVYNLLVCIGRPAP
jgi:Domain of unknown function (DUF222)